MIYMAPDERTVKTSVNPAVFNKYFPHIASERFDTELGEIDDQFLTSSEIEALGDRLEALLDTVTAKRAGKLTELGCRNRHAWLNAARRISLVRAVRSRTLR